MAKATPRSSGGRRLQYNPKWDQKFKRMEQELFKSHNKPAAARKPKVAKGARARKPIATAKAHTPPTMKQMIRKLSAESRQHRIAEMVKGGREIAAQQASNKIAKKANARSIAKVGHRMVGSASAKTSRSSPIKIRQAIKSAAPRAALRTFERSQAHVVKKARVGEKLAGRAGRQLARTASKTPLSVSTASARPPITRIQAPPVANRPIPLGRMGSKGPGLKTNLLRSRGVAATASVGAKLRARKLGRSLKSTASSAFHAPANLTSKLGAKVAGTLAGKRLTARLKG